jgi:hypothetical protein
MFIWTFLFNGRHYHLQKYWPFLLIHTVYMQVDFHFSFQRLAVEMTRNNVTVSRANGSKIPDSATNSRTTSVTSPVIGDSLLNSHLLEPSVVSGSLPLRLVYVRWPIFVWSSPHMTYAMAIWVSDAHLFFNVLRRGLCIGDDSFLVCSAVSSSSSS